MEKNCSKNRLLIFGCNMTWTFSWHLKLLNIHLLSFFNDISRNIRVFVTLLKCVVCSVFSLLSDVNYLALVHHLSLWAEVMPYRGLKWMSVISSACLFFFDPLKWRVTEGMDALKRAVCCSEVGQTPPHRELTGPSWTSACVKTA